MMVLTIAHKFPNKIAVWDYYGICTSRHDIYKRCNYAVVI